MVVSCALCGIDSIQRQQNSNSKCGLFWVTFSIINRKSAFAWHTFLRLTIIHSTQLFWSNVRRICVRFDRRPRSLYSFLAISCELHNAFIQKFVNFLWHQRVMITCIERKADEKNTKMLHIYCSKAEQSARVKHQTSYLSF